MAAPDPLALPDEAARLDRAAQILRTGPAGQQIVWRSWGEGAPLVLFHGGHGSWLHWIRNIPALSRQHRLILPDLPGFGDSDPLPETVREVLIQKLSEGLEELALPEKFHLGGFSFGCIPACYLLARLQPRVHRLFLIGSGGFGGFNPVTSQLRRWQDTPPGPERDAINRHNLKVLMIHDPAKVDDLAVRIQGINTARTVQNMRVIAKTADQRVPLSACPVPVTVVYGAEDMLAKGRFDERVAFLKGLTPPAEIEFVPGAGHWIQYEAADRVNEVILAAMARDLSR